MRLEVVVLKADQWKEGIPSEASGPHVRETQKNLIWGAAIIPQLLSSHILQKMINFIIRGCQATGDFKTRKWCGWIYKLERQLLKYCHPFREWKGDKAHRQLTKEREMGRKLHPLSSASLGILRNGAGNVRGKPEPSASINYPWQHMEKRQTLTSCGHHWYSTGNLILSSYRFS